MTYDQVVLIYKIAFVPVLLLTWIAASVLLARQSGWYRFAQRFRAVSKVHGESFWFSSAKLGKVFFAASLIIVVSTEGLFMRVVGGFVLRHPPLLIPWESIQITSERSYRPKWTALAIDREPIRIELPNKIVDAARPHIVSRAGGT